ncbi:DUF397 domain-containing protein [Actinomadura soli]|nr:DUF397 domain-containing protein [Actinomadura soli]
MNTQFFAWRKSRYSAPDGHCVEAGQASGGTIGVRDTKFHGNGPTLEFTRDEWRSLLRKIRADCS